MVQEINCSPRVWDRSVIESQQTDHIFMTLRLINGNQGQRYQSKSEVWWFQWGVKVERSSTCFNILQMEEFGKKEKEREKKVEVRVSQENKPFPEPNTAMV